MNRLNRPINSLKFTIITTFKSQFVKSSSSPPQSQSLSYTNRREFSSIHRKKPMEPSSSPVNLSSSTIDGFVHVENPNLVSIDSDGEVSGNGDELIGSAIEHEEENESNEECENVPIPEEVLKNVVVLSCDNVDGGSCDVYLVGTAHVSQESCREVQAVISCLKPQVVFLELCSSRVAILTLKNLKMKANKLSFPSISTKSSILGVLLPPQKTKSMDDYTMMRITTIFLSLIPSFSTPTKPHPRPISSQSPLSHPNPTPQGRAT